MSDAPTILTLDIATVTGFAHGPAGGSLVSGSFRAGSPGANNGEVGRAYGAWLNDIMATVQPRGVYVEETNFQHMAGRTTRETIERLCGLMMVTEMVVPKFGIFSIPRVKTGDFRKYFLGSSPPRKEAKRLMVKRCVMLGHEVKDDNAADAIGIHYFVSGDLLKGGIR